MPVVRILEELMEFRGKPQQNFSGNDPEPIKKSTGLVSGNQRNEKQEAIYIAGRIPSGWIFES